MTTILTLEPLGGNLFPGGTMKLNFGGAGLPSNAWEGNITRAWLGQPSGTAVKRVKHPADLSHFSITDGVVALDRMIKATAGNVLIVAHSQGAQVASRWMRTLATDSGAPSTSRVRFLLFGNPLRKYGGFGVGNKECDGTTGQATPTSPWTVTDYKLQYDGWADNPTRSGMWAVANAVRDRYGINGNRAIHALGYHTANLAHPQLKTFAEGTTTFAMAPHAPLLAVPRSWIERSYTRPETSE